MGIKERWKGFRELPPDIAESLERLIPLFEREGVLLAYLFGSLADKRQGNDVDLAVLMREGPAFRLHRPICDCLQTERVDLVDLARASPVLRFEVIRAGHPLYAADTETQERFELETLHLYRDTAWLRRRQRDYLKETFQEWSYDGKRLRHG